MKIKVILMTVLAATLCSCASVKTYDAKGNLLGECDTFNIWTLSWGAAKCTGSANPVDQQGKDYNSSKIEALYTALMALYSYEPKAAEDYFKNHVSIEYKNALEPYIEKNKTDINAGHYIPASSLSADELAFLKWLVLNHPDFSDISEGFKK